LLSFSPLLSKLHAAPLIATTVATRDPKHGICETRQIHSEISLSGGVGRGGRKKGKEKEEESKTWKLKIRIGFQNKNILSQIPLSKAITKTDRKSSTK
jgi:hypothetical protein